MPVELVRVIAVVDDDPDFQALLVEIFDDEGYAVAQHTEADTGLPALRRTAPGPDRAGPAAGAPDEWLGTAAQAPRRTSPHDADHRLLGGQPFLARHLHELHDQGCAALPKPLRSSITSSPW